MRTQQQHCYPEIFAEAQHTGTAGGHPPLPTCILAMAVTDTLRSSWKASTASRRHVQPDTQHTSTRPMVQ